MAELANEVVDLEAVLGRPGRELRARMGEAATWETRFALLDAFLLRRLDDTPEPPSAVTWAWHALRRSAGRVPIRALAEELGCSHRHLIASFRREVGLPPKTVARIVRFERALELARRPGRPGWASIAQDTGYADQAHLIRDFRAFAGTTPTALEPAQL
jgi:AraC-like DNA-binding protein